MLEYRLTVNNDPESKLTWSLGFNDGDSEYNDTEADEIFGVVREFVKILPTLHTLLGYRLSITNDPKRSLTWSLLFDDKNSKYNNTETDDIFDVAREFVVALSTLRGKGKVQPEEGE